MKINEILGEGRIKRLDPVISGERTEFAPKPTEPAPEPTKSAHHKKIGALAKAAGVSVEEVKLAWDAAASQVDSGLSNRWAIVMAKTKRALGL